MTRYVDGFLIPVPNGNMDAYKKLAEQAAVIWKDHGALEYCESVADDLEHEEVTSFRASAGAKPDETVVFAWIVYASREERDAVNAKVMADPRMAEMMSPDMQVFDCKRMAYGGFRMLVDM